MTGIDGYDWSPLGGSNPVPGDPDVVRTIADNLSGLASTVGLQNRLLRGVSSDASTVWQGPAAEKFHANVGPLPGHLDKLTTSYNDASGALHDYWPKLREAQNQALQALAKAAAAQQTITTSQSQLKILNGQVTATSDSYNQLTAPPSPFAPPPPPLTPAQTQAKQAAQSQAQANYQAAQARAATVGSQLTGAQHDLSTAQSMCAQAIADAKAAARTCASTLNGASHAGIRNPHHSMWGSITSSVSHMVGDVTHEFSHLAHEAVSDVTSAVNAVDVVVTDTIHDATAVVHTVEHVVNTAVHDTEAFAKTAVHDAEAATTWVGHHMSEIEFVASLALGPAGMLLTAKGRDLLHQGLQDVGHAVHAALKAAEPILATVSSSLGIVTGVLGIASLVLAPFGVGEVLDGLNEGLMALKTADDGLLLAAGDKEAEASLVEDGVGLATLGLGSAFEAASSTLKAGSEVAEAGEKVESTAEAAGAAAKVAQRADSALSKASEAQQPMAAHVSEWANGALTDANAASHDALAAQKTAQDALTDARGSFDLQSPTSYLENATGKTTLQHGLNYITEHGATVDKFNAENGLSQGMGVGDRFGKYYASQFSGPAGVSALRGVKTAYLGYDSTTFVTKLAGGPKIGMPDLASSAAIGG